MSVQAPRKFKTRTWTRIAAFAAWVCAIATVWARVFDAEYLADQLLGTAVLAGAIAGLNHLFDHSDQERLSQ